MTANDPTVTPMNLVKPCRLGLRDVDGRSEIDERHVFAWSDLTGGFRSAPRRPVHATPRFRDVWRAEKCEHRKHRTGIWALLRETAPIPDAQVPPAEAPLHACLHLLHPDRGTEQRHGA